MTEPAPDDGQAPSPREPHIVMLAGNDVASDNRIRKSAASAARLGARVTLLAYSPDGVRQTTKMGPVRVVRVPIAWSHRRARESRLARRRKAPLIVGYRSGVEEKAAMSRAQTEHARAVLEGREARALWWRHVRLQWVRARRFAQRLVTFGWRAGWSVRDRVWSRVTWAAGWPRLVPLVYDYDAAFAGLIRALEPDLIHAHDVELTMVASRASLAERAAGRDVAWIYDAHEYVRGLSLYSGRTARMRAAWANVERRFGRRADAIVTVSPMIAERLGRELKPSRTPRVVLNCPTTSAGHVEPSSTGVRGAAGVSPGTPLLVYSGGVTSARGVDTAIQSLRFLPGVHLAVVCVPSTASVLVDTLRTTAADNGVLDRTHFVDPVPPGDVVAFLSSADVGLLPLRRYPSHDMALANKLFEYLHAGLPVVVSDCPSQRDFVMTHRVGLSHKAADPRSLADSVSEVLVHRDEFARSVEALGVADTYSWEAQESVLAQVYQELIPGFQPRLDGPRSPLEVTELTESPAGDAGRAHQRRLVIGPANMAGQGWEWAQSVSRAFPSIETEVLAVSRGGLDFRSDVMVDEDVYANDLSWQEQYFTHLCQEATHVLLEAGRPIVGRLNGGRFTDDAAALHRHGVDVALVLHGSEIRDPGNHRARNPDSPFADPRSGLTLKLSRVVAEMKPLVRSFDGPVFVSTPDLLDDVDWATWLPVVVDLSRLTPSDAQPRRGRAPLVLHAPSRPELKGSADVLPVLERLAGEGLVRYRSVTGVPPEEVVDLLDESDIVLDQFAIGSYGVLACQAMAMNRLVIGHVAPHVREYVGNELPVVESRVRDLEKVMRSIVADMDAIGEHASRGRQFVTKYHDGRLSAEALAPFLGVAAKGE